MRKRFAGGATILLFLLTASHAPVAAAANFYVSTTGNDGFPGNQGQPFQTVGKAATVAMPGDTVYIHGGTYAGAINPPRSGTASAWITFSAFPGEVPILDGTGVGANLSGFEPTNVAVQYVRVVGLVARNWPSSGFSNGFDFPSSHIEFRNCIADGNGINGIAFYKTAGVLITNSIIVHNGNQMPSWSSGVNLFTVTGTFQDNQVIGNVSFENIDISTSHSNPTGHPTDGNGFILDQGSTGALFENNIAFGNGGSCIRLTNSSGAHIVNNTCYHDALNPNDGSPATPAEIVFSDATSATGVLVVNNLVAGTNAALNQTSGSGGSTFSHNVTVANGAATPFFAAPASVDFRPMSNATTVIDQAESTDAPASDIGFDPRCIKAMSGQAVAFWTHAVDYDYVASVGGVAGCFHPGNRPAGAAPDVGAYEFGAVVPDAGAAGPPDSGVGGSSGGAGDAGAGRVDASSGGGSSGGMDASGGGAPEAGTGGGSGSGSGGSSGASSSGGGSGSGSSSGSSGASSGQGGSGLDAGQSSGSGGSGGGSGAGGSGGAGASGSGCACRLGEGGSRDGAAAVSLPAAFIGLLAFAGRRRRRRDARRAS